MLVNRSGLSLIQTFIGTPGFEMMGNRVGQGELFG